MDQLLSQELFDLVNENLIPSLRVAPFQYVDHILLQLDNTLDDFPDIDPHLEIKSRLQEIKNEITQIEQQLPIHQQRATLITNRSEALSQILRIEEANLQLLNPQKIIVDEKFKKHQAHLREQEVERITRDIAVEAERIRQKLVISQINRERRNQEQQNIEDRQKLQREIEENQIAIQNIERIKSELTQWKEQSLKVPSKLSQLQSEIIVIDRKIVNDTRSITSTASFEQRQEEELQRLVQETTAGRIALQQFKIETAESRERFLAQQLVRPIAQTITFQKKHKQSSWVIALVLAFLFGLIFYK